MIVEVIAHPNSKKPRIDIDLTGVLHIYVSEPAMEGKANRAVVKALAKHFKTKPNKVLFVSGHKQKQKTFDIIV